MDQRTLRQLRSQLFQILPVLCLTRPVLCQATPLNDCLHTQLSQAVHTTPDSASPASNPGFEFLSKYYDSFDLDGRWAPNTRVSLQDWESGLPFENKKGVTHCSQFVAAALKKLGIYVLRQPDHTETGLATAQYEWLLQQSKHKNSNWQVISSPYQAQELANQGGIVIVAYPDSVGHIALVRPSHKPRVLIATEGPQLIQAGATNSKSIAMKQGFNFHPDAWVDAQHFSAHFFYYRGSYRFPEG